MLPRLHVAALASGILFGLASPGSKALVGDVGPFALAGLLYLGAAAAMVPALRGKALRPQGADRARLAGAVALGSVAGPVLLLFGLQAALASSVSIWLNLELVWTALLGWLLFREHGSAWSWLAVGAAVAASVAVAWRQPVAGLSAALLVAAACLAWGLDNHWTAKVRSIPPAAVTFWKGLAGGATSLTLGLGLGATFTLAQAGAALALGTVCYGVSIALYIRSARGIGATRAQVLFSTAPLWGVLGAVAALGEPWDWRLGLAVAFVALAVGFLAMDARKARQATPAPPG